MKITGIDCHVLLAPDYDAGACSSAQDDLVVLVHTDEGIVGVGETDTNPWVARECVRARGTHCMGLGLGEMLVGADPMNPEAAWEALYRGSKMTGRRGALICALGALDMALWDIKGQALGVPVARLLGGDPARPVIFEPA
jgi:L-alanine-DL-glutamate epimerase-like enolase superfamily enzyme